MTYVRLDRPSIAGDHPFVAEEIDGFGKSVERFRAGLVPEHVFLEHRLRHGVYGQRQDGVHMMRSKLPLGLIGPEQLEAFADITEKYSHGIAHLTTRQDIQVHFIPLERSPDVMRVLDQADMTSREACGNVVRNVCASTMAGVEPGEGFDVTAAGMALARFLLKIPDGQSLGRKFKITLAGSFDPRWNAGPLHDIGATAVVKDGKRGFHVVVGGGLGAVPQEARVFTEFLPEEELLPVSQAMLRVFGEHGEKKRRARARLKFLVSAWGVEKFRDEVLRVRAELPHEPAWTAWLTQQATWDDAPIHPPHGAFPAGESRDERQWLRTNVLAQKQPGYAAVRVRVPRGDLEPWQLRGLATLLRERVGDSTRIGIDQSLMIRQVALDHLLPLRAGLVALGLGGARAGGLGDTVTCPGADSCKLGITSPRAVARQMQADLDDLAADPRLERLRIHISGCPNSCAQHQVADIGFFGAAKTHEGVTAPHYMLVLGGLAGGLHDTGVLGTGFGTTILKLPAARVGQAIRRLAEAYLRDAEQDEVFGTFARRVGRAFFKELLADLTRMPSPSEDPELYREFGKDAAFKVVRGVGECAGAVVLAADLLLADADREADLATELFASGGGQPAIRQKALKAMSLAAESLLSTVGVVGPAATEVPVLFRQHFYDTGRIYEGVGHYFLGTVDERAQAHTGDRLRRLVVEAGLFVEEAHTVLGRLRNPVEAK